MILRPILSAITLALVATALHAQTPVPAENKSGPFVSPDIHTRVNSLPPADVKEAIDLLKKNYLNPKALTDSELDRATLQGLLSLIAPGGQIVAPAATGDAQPVPFHTEIIDNRIGYLRLGSLSKGDIGELDSALQDFDSKSLKSAILDLRATPSSNDFEMAAEVVKRFSPKGKILFTIKKPGANENRQFTSDQEPKFHGLLIALADGETAGAAEVALAALRAHAKAMIVGQLTAGQAAEFADMPLPSGKVLRVAVSEISLPGAAALFPGGVKPDIAVEMTDVQKQLRVDLENSVGRFVFDSERPRMNEAALVSGKNPELDALQAAQHSKSPAKPLVHDAVLQRAVDLVTSIGIYENRAQK